jgi:hypothetical protein
VPPDVKVNVADGLIVIEMAFAALLMVGKRDPEGVVGISTTSPEPGGALGVPLTVVQLPEVPQSVLMDPVHLDVPAAFELNDKSVANTIVNTALSILET